MKNCMKAKIKRLAATHSFAIAAKRGGLTPPGSVATEHFVQHQHWMLGPCRFVVRVAEPAALPTGRFEQVLLDEPAARFDLSLKLVDLTEDLLKFLKG
jgi:hypothetical protein